jgi:hypothetical protein
MVLAVKLSIAIERFGGKLGDPLELFGDLVKVVPNL